MSFSPEDLRLAIMEEFAQHARSQDGEGEIALYLQVEAERSRDRERRVQDKRLRLAVGLCPDCGRRPETDKRRCNACAARENQSGASRREERRAAGTCWRCGEPSGDKASCPKHLAEARAATRAYRERLRTARMAMLTRDAIDVRDR